MKSFLILLFLLCSLHIKGVTQAGDLVAIKKNGQTIKNFIKGSNVRFITTSGEWIQARINSIHNDSLFFKEVIVRPVPTPWGVTTLDTIATPIRGIRYTDIGAIPRPKEGFTYIKNGSILMIGGAGYILLNVVNGAYLHYPPFGEKNIAGISTAAAVFGIGFLMNKLHKPYLEIGKKYTVEYIKLEHAKP